MKPLVLSALSTVNALGVGLDATARGLRENRSGLRFCDYEDARLDTYIGRVDGVEQAPIEDALARYDCRNNRLAQMALRADGFADAVAAAAGRYGADRIALILGTSTSGLREGERAFARRAPETGALPAEFRFNETQDHHSLAAFVQGSLGLQGPAATVSTACSSSAKVFADAAQLIDAGICDAAVVGGADSLCLLTLYGFKSLELTADAPCCPNDAARSGISIGEAAGFALLERADAVADGAVALLLGYGESADAYHMSAPHPEGLGAELAMRRALEMAGLAPGAVDYINEHGTGSRQNDQVEDAAIARVFGDGMRSSSTKGATGHTLGAAGILEIAICCLAMRHGFIPGNVNLQALDPAFRCRVEAATTVRAVRHALNNSFGFGGSNCSILLGRPQ
jgi:3-oxoacyl-[acyl-carrier-protein] synthase-1